MQDYNNVYQLSLHVSCIESSLVTIFNRLVTPKSLHVQDVLFSLPLGNIISAFPLTEVPAFEVHAILKKFVSKEAT